MSNENPNKEDIPVVENSTEGQTQENLQNQIVTGEIVGEESVESLTENVITDPDDIVPEPPMKEIENAKVDETNIKSIMNNLNTSYGVDTNGVINNENSTTVAGPVLESDDIPVPIPEVQTESKVETPIQGVETKSESEYVDFNVLFENNNAENLETKKEGVVIDDVNSAVDSEGVKTDEVLNSVENVVEPTINEQQPTNEVTSTETEVKIDQVVENAEDVIEATNAEAQPTAESTVSDNNEEVSNSNTENVIEIENTTQESKEDAEDSEDTEKPEEDYEVLNEDNKNYLETGLSQRGKRFFGSLYEKLDNIPVFNKIAGKMAIAYNERFARINEKSTQEISEKIHESDQKLKQFAEIEHQLNTVLASLSGDNLPGTEKIKTSLRRIVSKRKKEEKRNQESRGNLATKIENYKSFVNERNRIADGLIGFYEKKMSPVKEKLDTLNKEKSRLSAVGLAQEVRIDTHKMKIAELEQKKNSIIELLKKSGMSDSKIESFPAVKSINKTVEKINKELEKDKKELDKKINKINKKINLRNERYQKIDKKKTVFNKVKSGQQVDFSELESKASEIVNFNINSSEENSVENSAEGERKSITEFVDKWNAIQAGIPSEEEKLPKINIFELLDTLEITEPQSFSIDQFGKILKAFYGYNSIPEEKVEEKIKIFKELINTNTK